MTNAGTSINDLGQVVGASQSSKDGNVHAFLWTKSSGMRDLGTLPGAVVTVAPCCNTINNRGQVVGFSIDGATGNPHALLWQGGKVMDLNNPIPAGSKWYLQFAQGINDAGEIACQGVTASGEIHGLVLTPKAGSSDGDVRTSVVPDEVRKQLPIRAPFMGVRPR